MTSSIIDLIVTLSITKLSEHIDIQHYDRQTQRHRDTQTHRLIDRQTDRLTYRPDRQTDWLTYRPDRQTHRQKDRHTQTEWQTHIQKDRQTHTEWQTHTDKMPDTQKDRHTDRKTQADTCPPIHGWAKFLMPFLKPFTSLCFLRSLHSCRINSNSLQIYM